MNIYIVIYSLVLLAVVYGGLRRIRRDISRSNTIRQYILNELQQMRHKLCEPWDK